MKEYEPQVLRKLQLLELDILKDFDAICRKHDIPYVVMYGAAIGAVRHGGFIPWDDDIDVVMLRTDYESFLKIAKSEFSNKYQILNSDENFNYPLIISRMMLSDTKFVIEHYKYLKLDTGIFLDIFPLDNIGDDKADEEKQYRDAWFWNKLMILRQMPFPNVPMHGMKKKVIHFICALIHYSLMILHISPKWLYKNCKEACLRHQNESTKRVGFVTGSAKYALPIQKDELFPPQYLDFEGISLPFPNQTDKVLRRIYDDYMQLPPERDRKNHYPYILDFGKYDD